MFKLVIQDDEGKTTVVPLIRDEITIGRKEGNTIRLTERNVSRRHARILRNNGEVQIEDLGSYNGIRVNNARIAERVSLRVSDQVQIGDYKLYLKAEGVEQVDDARTMPIERVDTNTATDVIPAVPNPLTAPTTPMTIPTPAPGALPSALPSSLPPGAQLVGSPNRTLVAIADTDPQGRPVATAAAVAALTAPVGYGKLVVLSSNFAGKEFELSRPQMIIGRTEENDIVINHRSISRNHAKLVREPDTGRYTISDLQSSNGVRVNGQDYGKVELRRGDVVDLGHVRLRFVEPGEDFVFARDAVITDVPDVGGKRNMLLVAIIGLVLLGGIAVVAVVMTKDEPPKKPPQAGINTQEDAGPDEPVLEDAPDQIVEAKIDAPGKTVPSIDTEAQERLVSQCKDAADKKRWQDLIDCSDQLAKFDNTKAKGLRELATREAKAEARARGLTEALRQGDYKKAKEELDAIPGGSMYRKAAQDDWDKAIEPLVNKLVGDANRAKDDRCDRFQAVMRGIDQKHGKGIERLVRARASCNPRVTQPPPPTRCDADQLKESAQQAFTSGNYGQALKLFEESYACRSNADTAMRAFISACNLKRLAPAKKWYGQLSGSMQNQTKVICIRNGIKEDDLK